MKLEHAKGASGICSLQLEAIGTGGGAGVQALGGIGQLQIVTVELSDVYNVVRFSGSISQGVRPKARGVDWEGRTKH